MENKSVIKNWKDVDTTLNKWIYTDFPKLSWMECVIHTIDVLIQQKENEIKSLSTYMMKRIGSNIYSKLPLDVRCLVKKWVDVINEEEEVSECRNKIKEIFQSSVLVELLKSTCTIRSALENYKYRNGDEYKVYASGVHQDKRFLRWGIVSLFEEEYILRRGELKNIEMVLLYLIPLERLIRIYLYKNFHIKHLQCDCCSIVIDGVNK
jgi:hypothetical protein